MPTETIFDGSVEVTILSDGITSDKGKHTFGAQISEQREGILAVAVYGKEGVGFELPITKGVTTASETKWNLFHSDPFTPSRQRSVLSKAGDIEIQLMTTGNIPIPGQLVFYYVKAGSALDNIVTIDAQISGSLNNDFTINDLWQDLQNKYNIKLVGYDFTNKEGVAVCNYFTIASRNIKNFATKLKEGPIVGNIEVVCVDPKSYSSNQDKFYVEIWHEDTVPVSILGIAKIDYIQWVGDPTEKPVRHNITVETFQKSSGAQIKKLITEFDRNYVLLPGDKIILKDNDFVKITWITGTQLKARPKSGKSCTIEIPDSGSEWWIKFVYYVKGPEMAFALTAAGILCNVAGIAGGSPISDYIGISIAIPGLIIAYKNMYDPMILEIYSNLLLDIDEDAGEVNIFLVDGRCIVSGVVDDGTTEMTTGQKVTVDKEGNVGTISSFSLDTLDEDLTSLLEYEDEDPVSTSGVQGEDLVSTSGDKAETQVIETPDGLTFESRNRPNGSEVQIPLILNGIDEQVGNLDLTLTYDPNVLEAIDVIGGSLTLDSIMEYNITPGNIKIALADGKGFLGDGSIIYVRFNVIGNQGQTSPLNITKVNANGASYKVILLEGNNGLFNVTGVDESRGDFDGNGRLTAVDALSALQMAVGKRPVDLSLDMNNDGKVTSLDARTILKIAVGNN
jgi:hypothetical protein